MIKNVNEELENEKNTILNFLIISAINSCDNFRTKIKEAKSFFDLYSYIIEEIISSIMYNSFDDEYTIDSLDQFFNSINKDHLSNVLISSTDLLNKLDILFNYLCLNEIIKVDNIKYTSTDVIEYLFYYLNRRLSENDKNKNSKQFLIFDFKKLYKSDIKRIFALISEYPDC